jgi:ferredoxin
MSTKITEECVNCGACLPECPNEAIREDEGKSLHVIDPEKCSECVGFFAKEKCQEVCPSECCVPDPANPETEDVLIARAKKLHPKKDFGASFPSRFRK